MWAALLLGVAGASVWPVAHAQVTPTVQLVGTLQIVWRDALPPQHKAPPAPLYMLVDAQRKKTELIMDHPRGAAQGNLWALRNQHATITGERGRVNLATITADGASPLQPQVRIPILTR